MRKRDKQKVLVQERDVFEKTVRKLYDSIIQFDMAMNEIIRNENYRYAQIVVVQKMGMDLISIALVYRDNLFFNKAAQGSLNQHLKDIGDTLAELDDYGQAGDTLATNIRDASQFEDAEVELHPKFGGDPSDNLERRLLQLNIQLGAVMFRIRRSYIKIRSTLLGIRYIVMQDFTRILLGVDLIRDYKDNQSVLQRVVIKALPIEELAKLRPKGGHTNERRSAGTRSRL